MSSNKNIFHEQQLLAIKVADLYNPDIRKKLMAPKKLKSVLPSVELLYKKEIVLENDPDAQFKKKRFNSDGYHSGGKFKKKYEYEDQDQDYYINDYPCPSEEIEYILVKEDRFHKKHRSNKKIYNQKKENLINKILRSEDDCHDKNTNPNSDNGQALSGGESHKGNANAYTCKIDEKELEVNRTSSNSNVVDNNLSTFNLNNKENILSLSLSKKNIFRKREISRFDFVKSKEKLIDRRSNLNTPSHCSTTPDVNTDSATSEVPEFISDMLYKKISRYTFFKKFTCVKDLNTDILYFEKELKNNNNSWAQFITSNGGCEVPFNKNNSFDFSKN